MSPELLAWLWLLAITTFIVVTIARFGVSHPYWEHDGGTAALIVSVIVLGTVTAWAAVVAATSLGAGSGPVIFAAMVGYVIGLAASGLIAEYVKLWKANSAAKRK
ncbi:MAG: hypothetical protein ACR2N7_07870 [Acidimicrobiia bacterium]